MQAILKRDYQEAMAGMIFGEVPDFTTVMNEIAKLEQQINKFPNEMGREKYDHE